MIVTVANQKGGVGKTTICIALANFLCNEKHREVLGIDFDFQGSFYYKWAKDSGKIESSPPYEVIHKPLLDCGPIMKTLSGLKNEILIVDLPGQLDNDELIPVYERSDIILCPFMYDRLSFESTFVFCQVIKTIRPDLKLVFVPNRLKANVTYRLQESVDKALNEFGAVVPAIADRIHLQRLRPFENIQPHLSNINYVLEKIYYHFLL